MGSRHASKGGGVKPRTVLLAFLAVIGLIQLWALSAHAPTAGSGSVGEGRDVLEVELPRGEPPAGYVGYYCKEDGIKCHTRTGRCWSADVCQSGSDVAPPPAGGLSHFWN